MDSVLQFFRDNQSKFLQAVGVMRIPCIVAIFLFSLSFLYAESNSFEIFNHQQVPFPSEFTQDEVGYTQFADFLADVAVSKGINHEAGAKLLAAALKLEPLNKKAFYTEYELSQGLTTSLAKPVEDIEPTVERYFAELFLSDDWQYYKAFILSSIKGGVTNLEGASKLSCSVIGVDAGVVNVALDVKSGKEGEFQFAPNGLDTSYFRSAYREFVKYIKQTQADALNGQRFVFQSSQEFALREGPASVLAAAVMSAAALEDVAIDSQVCLSGDVNADGSVQPIYYQRDRIEAALNKPPKMLIIPKSDQYVVDDLLLLNGVGFFVDCQVFEVSTVDQAYHLSKKDRGEKLQQAIEVYSQIQKVLKGKDGKRYLTNDHVRKRLEMVLELAPNHLSAQQVLKVNKRQLPMYLSLDGSFDLVYSPISSIYDSEKKEFRSASSIDDELLSRLERYKNRIDPKLQGLSNAVFGYKSSQRSLGDSANEKARLLNKLKEELLAVSRDVRIKERMKR